MSKSSHKHPDKDSKSSQGDQAESPVSQKDDEILEQIENLYEAVSSLLNEKNKLKEQCAKPQENSPSGAAVLIEGIISYSKKLSKKMTENYDKDVNGSNSQEYKKTREDLERLTTENNRLSKKISEEERQSASLMADRNRLLWLNESAHREATRLKTEINNLERRNADLSKELQNQEDIENNVRKTMEARIKELVDESQLLRNTLAMSSGEHQTWVIDSISPNLAPVKNKVKSALVKLSDDVALRYLRWCSTLVFEQAIEVVDSHLNQIAVKLGYNNRLVFDRSYETTQESRNTLAYRTKLFVKSVLQVNFSLLEESLAKQTEEKVLGGIESKRSELITVENGMDQVGSSRKEIFNTLKTVGMDQGAFRSLIIFAIKLQLLEPPLRHRFEPDDCDNEIPLLRDILNLSQRVYLFPAIDQWSVQENKWVPTKIQLTYID